MAVEFRGGGTKKNPPHIGSRPSMRRIISGPLVFTRASGGRGLCGITKRRP